MQNSQNVIEFWFNETPASSWFAKDPTFDQLIRKHFFSTYQVAIQGELYQWRKTAKGRLAEIIVLDQFSRNMFREQPQTFAFDSLAVVLSQEAIQGECDQQLSMSEKAFLYMPLMHSESLIIHQLALKMFAQSGLENNYQFELKHLAIIEKFGRYPHRNAVLGRTSTPAELDFLTQAGASF